MNTENINKTWQERKELSDQVFDDEDFSGCNLNAAILKNVLFQNCLFRKTKFDGVKAFNGGATNCRFDGVDFCRTTFASNSAIYADCIFEKCNFKGQHFILTRFVNCSFLGCRLQKINFNGSSFLNCRFVGKLQEVDFNGIYDTNKSEYAPLLNVDFSKAEFGDYVGFTDCDLSTCTPPEGKTFEALLYHPYENDSKYLSTGTKDRLVIKRIGPKGA